jgi:protein-S-isoprenylcysteine O-methyltransferase Ste14
LYLFNSPEASLGVAIAALLLLLGFRFARPDSPREWLAFVGYAGAIVSTFLASRGVLPGPAADAGQAVRLLGAAVLVLGLVLAGSAVKAGRLGLQEGLAGSGPYRRVRHTPWLGLALVLVGFLARAPSVIGAVTLCLAVLLAFWAALQCEVIARPRE